MFLRDWTDWHPWNVWVEPEHARSPYFEGDLKGKTVVFHGGEVHITDDPVSVIMTPSPITQPRPPAPPKPKG